MAFYFRKPIMAGPFRWNLPSGMGASFGLAGLRLGTGPRGRYFQANGGALYEADEPSTLIQDDDEIGYAARRAPSRLAVIVFTAAASIAAVFLLGWLMGPTEDPETARLVTSSINLAPRASAPSPKPPQIAPKQELAPQPPPNKSVSAKLFAKDKVNLRAGPSTSSPVVRKLPAGAAVTSLKAENGWRRIAVDGAEGWIRADLLSEKPPAAAPGVASSAPPSLPAPRPPSAALQKPVVTEPGSMPMPRPNILPR